MEHVDIKVDMPYAYTNTVLGMESPVFHKQTELRFYVIPDTK